MAITTVFVTVSAAQATATALLGTVTQAATAATSTSTGIAAPPSTSTAPYRDSYWACMSWVSLMMFCINILIIFIINDFNRLVAIPLVVSLCNTAGAGLNWYGWTARTLYSTHARMIAALSCNVFYIITDLSLPLYSFFILEKILKKKERKIYMGVFLTLYIGAFGAKWLQFATIRRYFIEPKSHTKVIGHRVDQAVQTVFSLIACAEAWSGFWLIRTFRRARKQSRVLGSRNGSLFAAMMCSSEIRLASLVIWGMTRLACFRSAGNATYIENALDRFAFTMLNCYPMILQLDVLCAQLFKAQASSVIQPSASVVSPDGSKAAGYSFQKSGVSSRFSIGSRKNNKAPAGMDSLRSQFDQYGMGAEWGQGHDAPMMIPVAARKRLGSIAPGPLVTTVAEVPEDKDLERASGDTIDGVIDEEKGVKAHDK